MASGRMGREQIVIRQCRSKLLKILPIALGMLAVSGLILGVSFRSGSPVALFIGAVAVAFFGPAFLILAHELIRPSYLTIDDWGVRFRFHSLEMVVPWENIREVGGGAGWPSLTFYDCEAVARTTKFSGWLPLGWLLTISTKVVSLILRRPLANLYPTNPQQLLQAFRANERMFQFHYGMPSSLLERSTREIVALLKRRKP